MLATSHILWSAVWFGIAADAVARAQAYVRAAARRQPGSVPPGALRLAEVVATLQDMKASGRRRRRPLRGGDDPPGRSCPRSPSPSR